MAMSLQHHINSDRRLCFWGKSCWLYSYKTLGGFYGNILSWMQWNWHFSYKNNSFLNIILKGFVFFYGSDCFVFFSRGLKQDSGVLFWTILSGSHICKNQTFHLILLCSFLQLWNGNNASSFSLIFGLCCLNNGLTETQGRDPFFTAHIFVNVELWIRSTCIGAFL